MGEYKNWGEYGWLSFSTPCIRKWLRDQLTSQNVLTFDSGRLIVPPKSNLKRLTGIPLPWLDTLCWLFRVTSNTRKLHFFFDGAIVQPTNAVLNHYSLLASLFYVTLYFYLGCGVKSCSDHVQCPNKLLIVVEILKCLASPWVGVLKLELCWIVTSSVQHVDCVYMYIHSSEIRKPDYSRRDAALLLESCSLIFWHFLVGRHVHILGSCWGVKTVMITLLISLGAIMSNP